MIAIINYGAGNLRSVENTLAEIGAAYQVLETPERLHHATKIILPGVGHIGQMMRAITGRGLRQPVCERIAAGVPFLGICLGLQGLFTSSEEAPEAGGLGIFPGVVRRFSSGARVPHMGWNDLTPVGQPRLLAGIRSPWVYFAHSYYVPLTDGTAASATYTTPYTAILERGNVYGVQFHPEKSGPVGLQIVRNFLEL